MTIPWSELGCKSFTFGTEYHLRIPLHKFSALDVYLFPIQKDICEDQNEGECVTDN